MKASQQILDAMLVYGFNVSAPFFNSTMCISNLETPMATSQTQYKTQTNYYNIEYIDNTMLLQLF